MKTSEKRHSTSAEVTPTETNEERAAASLEGMEEQQRQDQTATARAGASSPPVPLAQTNETATRRTVALCKACFFCVQAAWSAVIPFMGVFLTFCGFSSSAIGLMQATDPLSNLLAIQYLMYLVDRYHIGPHMLATTLFGTSLFLLLMLGFSDVPFAIPVSISASNSSSPSSSLSGDVSSTTEDGPATTNNGSKAGAMIPTKRATTSTKGSLTLGPIRDDDAAAVATADNVASSPRRGRTPRATATTTTTTTTPTNMSASDTSSAAKSSSLSLSSSSGKEPLALLALFYVFFALFKMPSLCLLDHESMEALPESEKASYGAIRAFGAAGWALGAFLSGLVQMVAGYGPSFVFYVVLMLAVSGMLYFLHQHKATTKTNNSKSNSKNASHNKNENTNAEAESDKQKSEEDVEQHEQDASSPSLLRVLAMLIVDSTLHRLTLHVFFIGVLGFAVSLNTTFLIIYLQQDLGASQLLLGLTNVAITVIEIPIFHCSDWIHAHISDPMLVTAAMASWVVRAIGYSLLQNAWWVLILEPLHGFTYAFAWLSGVHVVHNYFPNALSASAFGLVHVAYTGAGPVLGFVIGGYLFRAFGGRRFYRITGTAMAILTLLYVVADRYYASREAAAAATRATQTREEAAADDGEAGEVSNDHSPSRESHGPAPQQP